MVTYGFYREDNIDKIYERLSLESAVYLQKLNVFKLKKNDGLAWNATYHELHVHLIEQRHHESDEKDGWSMGRVESIVTPAL